MLVYLHLCMNLVKLYAKLESRQKGGSFEEVHIYGSFDLFYNIILVTSLLSYGSMRVVLI